MSQKIDHPKFIAKLIERFPEIAASIDDCAEGLLHLEMATLARATQAAIDSNDQEAVRRHFEFVDELFRNSAPDVENAVNVSYLENLRFVGVTRDFLPPRLKKALTELEEYLERLHGTKSN